MIYHIEYGIFSSHRYTKEKINEASGSWPSAAALLKATPIPRMNIPINTPTIFLKSFILHLNYLNNINNLSQLN